MEARVLRIGMLALTCKLSAFGSLHAQASNADAGTAISADERKTANRFRTYLEIPERRTEGVRGLLKMGATTSLGIPQRESTTQQRPYDCGRSKRSA